MRATFTHISISLRRSKRLLAGLFLLVFAFHEIEAQYASQLTGNWNTPTTWSPNGIPGISHSVIVNSGHVILLTQNAACNDLELNMGGVLNIGNFTFTLDDNFRIQGGSIIMGSGICYFRDDVIFATGGTFNWGTGTVVFDRNGNQLIPGPTQYHNVELGGSGIKTLVFTTEVNGNFTINDNVNFNGGGRTLNLAGNWTNNNSTDGFNENSCTVILDGTGIQTINRAGGETFGNLIVENTGGEVKLNCNVTVGNLTLRDGCCINLNGNQLNVTGTLLQDTPPEAKCKLTYSAFLDSDGTLSLDPAEIDNGSTVDCGTPELSLDITDFTCADIGTHTVTLTVKDIYESLATCQSSVTVSDNLPPTLTNCPSDIEEENDAGFCTRTLDPADPVFNDNCDVNKVTWSMSGANAANSPATGENYIGLTVFNIGTTYIKYIAEDAAGNLDSCKFKLTVKDVTDPVINVCASDTLVTLDASCSFTLPDFRNDADLNITECSPYTITQLPAPGTVISDTTSVTLTVTDEYGNSKDCTFIVNTIDVINPTAICKDVTLFIDQVTGKATLTVAMVNAGSSDNCSIDSMQISKNSFDCSDIGTQQVRFVVFDEYMNSDTCYSNVTVQFTIIPEITISTVNDTICNGSEFSTSIFSNTNSTEYSWTATYPLGISGASSGTIHDDDFLLRDTLINTTNSAQLVSYLLIPKIYSKCNLPDTTIYVWVEPTTEVGATPEADTICDGGATNIALSTVSIPTHPAEFRWKAWAGNNGEVDILPTGWNEGLTVSSTIIYPLDNLTDKSQKVYFEIESYTVDNFGNIRCIGENDTVVVWVEPTPKVVLNAIVDTICTYLTPIIETGSVTQSLQPVRLYYESQYDINQVEVIHVTDTFNLEPGLFKLVDTVINHSSVPQKVTFIVYPYLLAPSGVAMCHGIPDTAIIWVAPELKIIVDSISTYIGGKNIRCSGENNGFIHLKPEGGISAFSGYTDGDLNYSWNSGWKTTRDIQSIVAGTYNITVNDQLMCVDDSSFIMDEPQVLSYFIKVVTPLDCAGNDGKLSGNIHGGTPGYSYLWTKVPEGYGLETPAAQDTLYSITDGNYILSITDTNGCTQSPADTTISQPTAAAVVVGVSIFGEYNIRCHGENSGSSAIVNNQGGLPIIQYHWIGPGIDTSFTNNNYYNFLNNLYAGNYTLTYKDEHECTVVQSYEFIEPDSLLINQSTISLYPNGYNVTCYGRTDGSIQLNDITGGNEEPYQFHWETISGGSIGNPLLRNQNGLSAGMYAVTVEDAQNCSVSDTFTILQPEKILTNPELSAAQTGSYQMNCFGDTDGYIKLHTTGGIPGYQYLWADNGSSATERFDLVSGEYIVTVTDISGCGITDTIAIRQPDKLIVDSVFISNHTGFGVSCYNATDGVIFVKPEGGTGTYKYTWSSDTGMLPQDTGYIENLAAGNYQVEIADSNHCKTNFNTVIIQPAALQANIVGHNMNCTGSVLGTAEAVIAGGTGQYDYLWSNGAITATISGLNPAEYILTVTDDNACSISDTIKIIQNTEVVLDVDIDKVITCNGMSDGILRAIASEGVPPYIYQWQDGPAADIYSGLKAGTYSVHVMDHEGCEGVKEMVFDDPDQLVADYIVNDALCHSSADGSVTLDATGGTGTYQFNWNGIIVTGNEVTGMISGDYPLRISDEKGCFVDTVVYISQPEILRIKMDKDGTILPFCPDWHNGVLSITVKGGTRDYSYTWDGEFGDIHDSVLTEVAEGNYRIHVIDAHNCKADTTVKLKALNGNCLEIPSAFTPDGNFINDNWEIRYMTEDGTEIRFNEIYPEGQISIYDRIGKVVYSCSGGCAEDWDGRDTQGRLVPVDTYYFIIKLKNGDGALKGIITIIR